MDIATAGFVGVLQRYPGIPCGGAVNPCLPPFTYQPPDAPPLVELRTRYGLAEFVAGMDDLRAALRLLAWVHGAMQHDGGAASPEPRNALNILNVCEREKRSVNCRMKAIVLNEVYLSMGLRARYITCMPAVADGDCHVLVMVYLPSLGRWGTVNPTHDTYFTDDSGAIVNVLAARRIYRDGGLPGLRRIDRAATGPLFCSGIACASYDEFYLLYMSKNCFRFAVPVASAFGYESRPDAQFVYVSPPGYDPASGAEYDPARCFSTHDAGCLLARP